MSGPRPGGTGKGDPAGREVSLPRRRIALVDPDPGIGRLLLRDLPAQGFSVGLGAAGDTVLERTAGERPDVVVVGCDLLDGPVLALIRALRRHPAAPVLVLLGRSCGPAVIEALEAGADDCMGKPFLVAELGGRLRKMVRRKLARRGIPGMVRGGGLEIDCVRWHVRLEGRDVALSWREDAMLRMLVENAGGVVGTHAVLQQLWATDQPGPRRDCVRQLVGRLRRKLGMTSAKLVRIRAEPQVGYRLLLPSASRPAARAGSCPR